jgi:hypothetical protein
MTTQDTAAAAAMSEASSLIEGGLFYPMKYIVVGLSSQEDAARMHQALLAKGWCPPLS